MEIVSKFVQDLVVGDVIVAIDTISGIGPVLHYVDGNPTIHHAEVIELEPGWEQSPVFDPIAHNQDPPDVETRQYSLRERVQWQVETTNAQPNANKQFPVMTVRVAGFENGNRLDQLPAEYMLRVLQIVQVIHGDVNSLLETARKELTA